MKVLVVGARGRLGAAVAREFQPHADVVALGHADIDITDDACVQSRVSEEAPDVVVNCAAYNDVDAAENDPVRALNVNALGVRALARAAESLDATLVHYSTDFVFDGTTDRPYVESDPPNPQSVYAMSKLLGEWFAADVPRHYVLRVESLFGDVQDGETSGSVATIVARLQAGAEVPVFVDRTVSPTYVVDAAAATRALIDRKLPYGLYHCVNSGRCTWWEFSQEVARLIGRPARLKPITLDSVSLPAPRPIYGALSNERLAACGVVLPTWNDALRRAIDDRGVRA
jgi:dTDP-4-dehydrorhamnose reductase